MLVRRNTSFEGSDIYRVGKWQVLLAHLQFLSQLLTYWDMINVISLCKKLLAMRVSAVGKNIDYVGRYVFLRGKA